MSNKRKIFVGSSSEAEIMANRVLGKLIDQAGMELVPWRTIFRVPMALQATKRDEVHCGASFTLREASASLRVSAPRCHSYRSASVGFSRDARVAGNIPKTSPTAADTTNADTIDAVAIGISIPSTK